MAVPALRVLEDKEGGNGKKIKKNIKGGLFSERYWDRYLRQRGFVDVVKAARKCGKANVPGKAVEYIGVLKLRENRLKVEQAALKTLLAGLVGALPFRGGSGGSVLAEMRRMKWRGEDVEGHEEEDGDEGDDEFGR